ncbi:MAG: decarboxylase [Nanoarchaeota archaeon]
MTKLEPKFILSKKKVFKKVDFLKNIVDEVSYSWKTNPKVGEILNNKNYCYLSVHSINELEQVKNKSKIWYFPFAINNDDLNILINKYNIKNFIIDNEDDLNILRKYIKKNKIIINVLIRMKLQENSIQTGKHFIFGMNTKKTKELLTKIHQDKNINKIGIHVHRKTQNISQWSLEEDIFESLDEQYLKMIDIINIGGGLPGKYKNTNNETQNYIFEKIKKFTQKLHTYNIQVIIEPGRFIASSSVKLETHIIKIIDNTCFLNCSIFNGCLDTVVANIKLLVQEETKENQGEKYTLKGCTPDSCDILRYSVYLKNPKVNDKITFLNCGAYTYTTNFCALKEIKYEILDDF